MISKRTVLILGCGASKEYGFPNSSDLKKNIIEKIQDSEMRTILNQVFGFSDFLIDNFSKSLEFSGLKYVENFLIERPEYQEIGKLILGLIIKEKENIKTLFDDNPWYSYLYEAMNDSFDNFDENKLSIITFNFDRSIETYLFNTLKNSYNKPEEEILEKLNKIPIIHINGKIGGSAWYADQYGVPFDRVTIKESLVENAKEIKTLKGIEMMQEDKEIEFSRSVLEEAESIVFLGFGYDEENMLKLRVNDLKDKTIIGSTFGLKRGEIKSIMTKNGNLELGKTKLVQNLDVLGFLKESGILQG